MKKTKIIATISDQMCDVPLLTRMHQAGMDVVRLNTAHQAPEDALLVINTVRKVSDRIAIIIAGQVRGYHLGQGGQEG